MASLVPQFFAGWQAPPQLTPAPAQEALAQRILKLAQFAARNGPTFVELIKTKQRENSEYDFLFAGEGSDYYHWVLYCHLYGVAMGELPGPPGDAAPAAASAGAMAPPEPVQLDTAASLAAGEIPVLSGVPHMTPAAELGAQLLQAVGGNDVAAGQQVRSRARWDEQAPSLGSAPPQHQQQQLQQQQRQQMGLSLNALDQCAPQLPQLQQQQRYGQHLSSEAQAFAQQVAYSGAVSSGYPLQLTHGYAHIGAQQWNAAGNAMAGQHGAWGSGLVGGPLQLQALPYMQAPLQVGVWGSPTPGSMLQAAYLPHVAPPPPVAKDPLSFPPGLIPQLVKEKLRLEAPYSPLSTLEVEAVGMPPSSEPDAYLRSRIQRFYAELQDYRTGVVWADVEAEQRKQWRLESRSAAADGEDSGRCKGVRWEPMNDTATGQQADGSFSQSGASDSKASGLGFDDPCPQPSSYGSVYDAFRNSRSGRYHEVLARNQFSAAASRGSA